MSRTPRKRTCCPASGSLTANKRSAHVMKTSKCVHCLQVRKIYPREEVDSPSLVHVPTPRQPVSGHHTERRRRAILNISDLSPQLLLGSPLISLPSLPLAINITVLTDQLPLKSPGLSLIQQEVGLLKSRLAAMLHVRNATPGQGVHIPPRCDLEYTSGLKAGRCKSIHPVFPCGPATVPKAFLGLTEVCPDATQNCTADGGPGISPAHFALFVVSKSK